MKKLFALILAICTIALTFAGCDMLGALKPTEETVDPTLPKSFTYGEMTITLPPEFSELSGGKYQSDDYLIRSTKMAFSSITPLDGNPFPTLEVFMKNFYSFKEEPEKITVMQQDGISYVDYVTTANNIASLFKVEKDGDTQCFVGFESETAFYIVSFYSSTLDYETVRAQALVWAKTVTFAK